MVQNLFNFILHNFFTFKYRSLRLSHRALVSLKLGDVYYRMKLQVRRKVKSYSYWVDQLNYRVRSYPLCCKFASEIARQLQIRGP